MRNSSSGKGRGANLLLAAGVVSLTLAGIELALFLFYPTDYLEVAGKDSDYLFNEVVHQPSTVPGLSFELSPNRQKKLEGTWIRTNTFGMRDAEPGPFQDESPTRVVVLGYVLNDPESKPVQPLNNYFQEPALWQQSNLARLVAKASRGLEIMLWGDGDYYRYLHSLGRDNWDNVVTALGDIQELTASQDVPVLVVIFPETPMTHWSKYPYADLHQQVAEASRGEGFAVIDLLGRFSEYPARTMRVRRGDPHPSPLGHEIAAEAIYEWIVAELETPAGSVPLSASDS